MTRTVKVVLDVEEDPFVRGVKRSDDALGGLDKTLGKADTSAKSTATTLGKATDQLGKTGRAAKAAGQDLDEMRRHAATLDRQIRDTERSLASLAKGFANTGDKNILKSISDQQSTLRNLKNVRGLLPDPQSSEGEGRKSGNAFSRGFLGAVNLGTEIAADLGKLLPPEVKLALIAGAVAASPVMGAAVVGAVSGAAGGVGIGAGIALALRDPVIKEQASRTGNDILDQLTGKADRFAPEIVRSLDVVENEFARLGDEFDRIFDSSAKFLVPLAEASSGAFGDIVEGLDRVIASAGPSMEVLGAGIAGIGGQVEQFLNVVAENADTGANALNDIFTIAQLSISQITLLVDVLAEVYEWTDKLGGFGIAGIFSDYAGAANQAAVEAQNLDQRNRELAGGMNRLIAATQDQRSALKALADQTRAQTDPAFALLDAQEKLATAHDAVTTAQRKFGQNSPQARKAVRDLTLAALTATSAAGGLGNSFDGKMTPGLRGAMIAAGATKSEMKSLERQLRAAKREADRLAGNYNVTVTYKVNGSLRSGNFGALGDYSGVGGLAKGGVLQPMAAGGIASVYPASNPPLYQFAEPETGGEAFIPRRGDRQRGRKIVAEVASWYDMAAVPMAAGGITTAARGLVNVAPRETLRRTGGALESMSAYLSARDAVAALNAALRENGRSMSLSTTKGRENRTQLISSIRAAQDAAKAKYDETGSVKAANAEYDAHIRRLRQVLAQQKVSAATRNSLLKQLGGRPAYDTAGAAPANSSSTVAFVQAQMGAEEATAKARGFFDASWGTPTFAARTATGRDNLGALFDFLGQAGNAAQARYKQTGSARLATGMYDDYLRQLRVILAAAGMSKREIDSLLKTYGRITLGNRMGGVYEHARSGLLRDAHIAAGGPTRYAYAESGTGGELFAPKRGNLAKTRAEVGWAVNNWWGGDVRWQSGRGASNGAQSGQMTVRVVVQDGQIAGLVRVEVDSLAGALADAQVYSTVS